MVLTESWKSVRNQIPVASSVSPGLGSREIGSVQFPVTQGVLSRGHYSNSLLSIDLELELASLVSSSETPIRRDMMLAMT